MALYAYCLSDESAADALEGCAGVGGSPPRVVRCRDLWATVGEFERERVGVTRENVSAHSAVLSRVLARTTPLPFRFGTLASGERLEQFVAGHGEKLSEALSRVRGCVEMSVKVMWGAGGAGREDEARVPSAEAPGSGAAYLAAKRRALLGDEDSRRRAEGVAAWLAGAMGDAVRESSVTLRPSEALVLSAAHLVERARLEDYRERLRRARVAPPEGLRLLTSGAWPPYSFCDLSPAKNFGLV